MWNQTNDPFIKRNKWNKILDSLKSFIYIEISLSLCYVIYIYIKKNIFLSINKIVLHFNSLNTFLFLFISFFSVIFSAIIMRFTHELRHFSSPNVWKIISFLAILQKKRRDSNPINILIENKVLNISFNVKNQE